MGQQLAGVEHLAATGGQYRITAGAAGGVFKLLKILLTAVMAEGGRERPQANGLQVGGQGAAQIGGGGAAAEQQGPLAELGDAP